MENLKPSVTLTALGTMFGLLIGCIYIHVATAERLSVVETEAVSMSRELKDTHDEVRVLNRQVDTLRGELIAHKRLAPE